MKKRVEVSSVVEGPQRIDMMIVAYETREVEGKEEEIPIGENALSFPKGTKPKDMVKPIREAAKAIEDAAAEAKKTREDVNKLLNEEDESA